MNLNIIKDSFEHFTYHKRLAMRHYLITITFLFFPFPSMGNIESSHQTMHVKTENIPKSALSLKKNVYSRVCQCGLQKGPTEKYGVYIFCDDAIGTTIGIINLKDYENLSEKAEWNIYQRFWQDKDWALDVHSIEWSEDGLKLIVTTNYIYGTGSIYSLDLPRKKILSVTPTSPAKLDKMD